MAGISNPKKTDTMLKKIVRTSFTLIELLVVVAIIAVLVAILLPSLAKARAQSQLLVCSSNARQISFAFQEYISDFNGWLTPPMTYNGVAGVNGGWGVTWSYGFLNVSKTVPNGKIFRCPSHKPKYQPGEDNLRSYALNGCITTYTYPGMKWMKQDEALDQFPGDTVGYMIENWAGVSAVTGLSTDNEISKYEENINYLCWLNNWYWYHTPAHLGTSRVNMLFLDGHVAPETIDSENSIQPYFHNGWYWRLPM
jgi:prepilin-type processing-associated H-X9-DG protein/prepilin-type N-terminal cleavage/methylation domain-containing protein